MLPPVVQSGRIKVRAIPPDERPELRIQMHSLKHCRIAQRPIKLAPQDRLQINESFQPVIEANEQPVAAGPFEFNDVIKWVRHGSEDGGASRRFLQTCG